MGTTYHQDSTDQKYDPCPYNIISNMGSSFVCGTFGGGIVYAIKASRNSPKGQRLLGAYSAILTRAPVLGGNFAFWMGLVTLFDCAIEGVYQKDDPLNSVASIFLTGYITSMTRGPRLALCDALDTSLFMVMVKGLEFTIERQMALETKLCAKVLSPHRAYAKTREEATETMVRDEEYTRLFWKECNLGGVKSHR
ncbi:translocase of the inner membrane [Podila humilis]|nr:translocase of the inner membrane [Podila humilis]